MEFVDSQNVLLAQYSTYHLLAESFEVLVESLPEQYSVDIAASYPPF